uniref:Thermonuclease family protein n=1 Tax=Oscillatoriales cyanobacterium SpSt-402 TaxID=2282168 RepID=A0A832H3K6_9CYAN
MLRTFIATLAIALTIVPSTWAATVVSTGDGDTLRVKDGGKTVTIRLGCIDAPERSQRPWGQMASDRLKQLLPKGQTVTLREIDRDRYGRTVAEVFTNGRSVNLQMVSDGMAAVYRQYVKNCDISQFNQAEQRAKQLGLGIWNPSNPLQVMPWQYRKRR